MIWLLLMMYVWAGITTVYGLWQIEEIGEAINGLLATDGVAKIKRNLKGNPFAITAVIAIWPVVAPMWAWHSMRHNVEFSGGAPLHGAASAGTRGYADDNTGD